MLVGFAGFWVGLFLVSFQGPTSENVSNLPRDKFSVSRSHFASCMHKTNRGAALHTEKIEACSKAIEVRSCMHKSNRRAVLHAQKQSRHAQKAIGERSCIIKSNRDMLKSHRGAVMHA